MKCIYLDLAITNNSNYVILYTIHSLIIFQRMREYERMKAEVEAASGISSIDNTKEGGAMSASDMTSNSSAQDMGSESSFSDLPVSLVMTFLILY